MTLSFSTKWDDRMGNLAGQPNYFVEQIWQSFPDEIPQNYFEDYLEGLEKVGYEFLEDAADINSKPHTIREDKSDRWEAGMNIHMVINNRTKNRFQFAPIIKCVSVQDIEIQHTRDHAIVIIDGKEEWNWEVEGTCLDSRFYTTKYDCPITHQLAINDGFPSVEAFFQYFNKDFKGKIIHWTDLKY